MWTPVPGESSVFLVRRFAHETVIHRADAILAVGAEFTVDEEVALDALDEWMELGSLPLMFEFHPQKRELIDLTGEAIAWRRAHEKAAVAVRGPLTDLLLVVYRRRPARSAGIEILGDGQLLDFWLERIGFG